MFDCLFDDSGELAVLLFPEADIARVDTVFIQRLRAGRVVGKQFMSDVVEVTHDGSCDAHLQKLFLYVRHGCGGFVAIHRDADHLGAGARQGRALLHGGSNVGGIGIGHGLHGNGVIATNPNRPRAIAHPDGNCPASLQWRRAQGRIFIKAGNCSIVGHVGPDPEAYGYRLCSAAGGTHARQFDDLRAPPECGIAGQRVHRGAQCRGSLFRDTATTVADQKCQRLAFAVGMATGQKGVARRQAMGEPLVDQKIQHAVNGDRCGAFASALANPVDQLIGAHRLAGFAQYIEHGPAGWRELDMGNAFPVAFAGRMVLLCRVRIVRHG